MHNMPEDKKKSADVPVERPAKTIDKAPKREWIGIGDSAPTTIRVQPTQEWPQPTKKKDK
jgi:hypothetical protein